MKRTNLTTKLFLKFQLTKHGFYLKKACRRFAPHRTLSNGSARRQVGLPSGKLIMEKPVWVSKIIKLWGGAHGGGYRTKWKLNLSRTRSTRLTFHDASTSVRRNVANEKARISFPFSASSYYRLRSITEYRHALLTRFVSLSSFSPPFSLYFSTFRVV